MTDREAILGALGASGADGSLPGVEGALPESRGVAELWSLFEANLVALGGRMAAAAEVEEATKRPTYADEDVPGWALKRTAGIWDAEVGVTVADLVVADTGSIIVSAGAGRARLASLAPPIHIVLVPEAAIVG